MAVVLPLVQVALPLPVATPYTYAVPTPLADRVAPGARVVVPVRRREMVGIVVGVDEAPPAVQPREILAAPDDEPALPPSLLRTAEWMAGYYGTPLGLALKAMLPGPLWGESELQLIRLSDAGVGGGTAGDLIRWLDRKGGRASMSSAARALGKPLWSAADRLVRIGAIRLDTESPPAEISRATVRALELAEPRLGLLERDLRFARRPRRREVYELVEQAGAPLPIPDVRARLGVSAAVIDALVDDGLVRVVELEQYRDPFAAMRVTAPPLPSEPQRAAVERISTLAPGQDALLFGVTGSGKTLVYLEAISQAVATGRGAIVLVPEIGLTPQTVSRVRGVFGDRVAVLHSALSEGERTDAWRALRRGERLVAVGPRSAVFAPIPSLGYIVIDEEHEATYKNGEAPRYHARDVARVRCKLDGARLVLGSATPSLETAAALARTDRLIRLPDRVGSRPLPPVELIDVKTAPQVQGVGGLPWSVALDDALRRTVARGEQALLLLNRRGFATFLQCSSCGDVVTCPHCSISLTMHRHPARLRCHYCGYHAPLDDACQACGHPVVRSRGVGTQQVEQVVAERVPEARVARMDLDTTGTKWSHHRILERVEQGQVDILVGTQMVAKGIDFPNVTLVGVVDADVGLHLPDFRAAERTFQLITQVAGRAGRGPKGGRVLVQTRNPEHPALRLAAEHDTEAFWAMEGAAREDPPYPPTVSLVNIIVSGTSEGMVSRTCARAADWVAALVDRFQLPVVVLGPAPCPVEKVKDRFRWHVVLKGPDGALGRIVRYASSRLTGTAQVRIAIDRDPVSML